MPLCTKFERPEPGAVEAAKKLAEEIRTAGCEVCAGPVAWFESVCLPCADRALTRVFR